jgi:hypothetical protein
MQARRARAEERAARLLALLPQARDLLIARHGARTVRLFGSLAVGDFTEHSDVDLAVEGLDGSRYFAALSELMTLFGGPVDLVPMERAAASLRDRIAVEGKPL